MPGPPEPEMMVDDATSRIPPLPRPWSDEDAAAIGRWGHPAAEYPPLLLTRVLQRHPGLADRTRLLIVNGWYRMIATTCNALDLGVERWMRAWPTDPSS